MFTPKFYSCVFFFYGVVVFLGFAAAGCEKQGPLISDGQPLSVQELIDKLNKGNCLDRFNALLKLEGLRAAAKPAVPALIGILEDDKSPIPGADAAVKNGSIPRPEDANPSLRSMAAAVLGGLGSDAKAAIPALLKNLKDKDKYVRCLCADALAGIGSKEERVMSALKEALNDPLPEVRIDVAEALNELDPDNPDTLCTLIKLLKDKDPETRRDAASVLEQIRSTKINTVVPALLQGLKDLDDDVRAKVVQSLGLICEESNTVLPALVERLEKDTSSSVRLEVVRALREFGPEAKSAIPALRRVVKKDANDRVRELASQAIRCINTMPVKRGRKGGEEEFRQFKNEHPEFKDLLRRRRGIKDR